PNVIAVQPPPVLPINWLPEGKAYELFHALNERVVLGTLGKVIRDYRLKNFLYLNCFNPYYAGTLPQGFGQALNIYQCIDDTAEEAYSARHGHRLEVEAIRRADICLVTSSNLQRLKRPLNPRTYILHNAVDWNIFGILEKETPPRPPELEGIPHPILGFTGNLDDSRIDFALLRSIAENRPAENLVLVGPINSRKFYEEGLDRLPNVHHVSAQPIERLPAFLAHFDVLLIPFRCTPLTASIYPLKINEYLASGKPVVSTDFSEDIRGFGDLIYLAQDRSQFLEQLPRALRERDPERQRRRREHSRNNSWEARVRQLWELLTPLLAERQAAPAGENKP
ncbi:MAG: glycosyltransferase, partial [Bacteroidetes bacterium]